MKTISILGCGWIGFPLASALVQRGWEVKGSTTSDHKKTEIQQAGIVHHILSLDQPISAEKNQAFFDSAILFVNVPPKIRAGSGDFHLEQIQHLISYLPDTPVREIIYVSATSVYPDLNRVVTEEDTDENHLLARAETLLKSFCTQTDRRFTVMRYGGLLGYDRIPCKYLSGRKDQTRGDVPVNFIHKEDAVASALHILKKSLFGEVFNLVAPLHPTREEVMSTCSKQTLYEAPEFVVPEVPSPFRIVSAEKILASGFVFRFPDPLLFTYNRQ